jgi:hypothetical protein
VIRIELHRGVTAVNVGLADRGRSRMRAVAARAAQVIRVDAIWLAVQPLDMRAGSDTLLAQVVAVFGAAQPHHAYCLPTGAPRA